MLHFPLVLKEKNKLEDCSFSEKRETTICDSKNYMHFHTSCHISKPLHRLCNSKSKI
ncbi:hypothetical protein Fmac_030097 [Flemingia macrophylla]|uniref:Uncharacterized protein n=1 Tax=Flemingia macrophylla TaxID=520843 RepID=A0ABD1LCG1_9FABA